MKVSMTIDVESYRITRSLITAVPPIMDYKMCALVKGMGVWRNNHAYWLMEDTMRQLIPAGIPQFLRKFVHELFIKPYKPDVKTPKVFSLEDLKFGFVTWLIACSVAFSVFVIELTWFYGVKAGFGLYCFYRILHEMLKNVY